MHQIAEWLEELGMSEYAQRFAENRIDISVLSRSTGATSFIPQRLSDLVMARLRRDQGKQQHARERPDLRLVHRRLLSAVAKCRAPTDCPMFDHVANTVLPLPK